MLNLKVVQGCSVLPAPSWLQAAPHSLFLASPSFMVARSRSHHQLRNNIRLTLSSAMVPHLEIFSRGRLRSHSLHRIFVGTRSASPCSAYAEGTSVAENDSLGNVHRKEREARIRKQLQEVTVSPSAYDTVWVSMVPLSGSTHTPCFPQCIEWILQNQEDNGSWGIKKIGSSVNKHILLSTLACVIALKKWNLGEEHVRRGLHFIGRNFSIVMDKHTAAPVGFSLIFPGMLSLAIGMGLQLPAFRRTDIEEILHLRREEFERLSMEKSDGTKEYIAFVSEGLGNLVDWSAVMKFQRKNGSLFNSPSTTAALLVHKYDDKALQFLSSVVSKFGCAVPTVYPLNIHCQLSLVDSLERIGISKYFSSEIKSILDNTYSLWLQRDEEIMLDLGICSIAFRLLRMNGYGVSADDLSHVAELSSFRNSLHGYLNHTNSLLELYKASKVRISENELILDKIGIWSGSLLMEVPLDGVQRLPILREIENALKYPFYTTLERLDHRRSIENFDVMDSQMLKTEYMPCGVNEDLLSLAVEDFTISQSIYQDEIVYLDSWMKENRLDQLQFARPKAAYGYLCGACITSDEQFDARISIAKGCAIVTAIDDFFDGEGSEEELKDLISLVEKWEEHPSGKLYSENVKILFCAIYTTVEELGSMVSAAQNFDVTEVLVESWLQVLQSMMIEAEWRMNHYMPTIEEYMKNAVVSISWGPLVLSTICLSGQKVSKWIFKDQEYIELLRLISTSTRLLNDIQGNEREDREGKLNSVLLYAYHSGGSMSIEMAKDAIGKTIITTTRDLLSLVLREENAIPRPCKEVFWKMCTTTHFLFFESDGYSSSTKLVSEVNALIYEPLKLAS